MVVGRWMIDKTNVEIKCYEKFYCDNFPTKFLIPAQSNQ